MTRFSKKFLHLSSAVVALSALGVSAQALGAETETEVDSSDAETIIVTGVRGKPRSVQDSPVPIDVFSAEDLESISHTDVNNIIQTLVPSYTLGRAPIADGATFIRPASLRGLPTDKTLVLVNGHRRHRSALVSIGGSGTQGPDLATIPAIALKNVEVLRDGASSQYGSDAIAGVINFILKDDAEGVSLTAQTGQFYEGDGFEYTLQANAGFALGDAGFVNVSLEYYDAESTQRAEQYCEPAWFCVEDYAALPGNEAYAAALPDVSLAEGDLVQPWGRPNASAIRGFVNMGYDFSDALKFYAFGNYSSSEGDGNFFYRFPGNSVNQDIRLSDGSIYNPVDRFPGGFTPQFSGDVTDYSITGGFKGDLSDTLSYDISGRHGSSKIEYTIENTINPSMGPDSPTEFTPGDLINTETQVQGDLVKLFDVGLAGELVVAVGGTYLAESYELVEGDVASYAPGPWAQADPFGFCLPNFAGPTTAGAGIAGLDCTDRSDPVYHIAAVGSNGFPGYSPEFSGVYDRDSYAFYADFSADVTDKWFLQGAVRFENYSDFDSVTTYKFATSYELIDGVNVRGSYGTGFRAPTPGQQGTTNVSTRLPDGVPVATGLFPAGSAVAQALGATPLLPEKSKNITAGVTGSMGDFSLSLDFYRIALEDRLNSISTITVVDDCDNMTPGIQMDCPGFRGNLAGVVGAESIGGVFYFTNAFDTVTKGLDVVATYDLDFGTAGSTSLTAAFNYNETEFDGPIDDLFNAESQFDFVNGDPNWRGVVTAIHSIGDFTGIARANYFGGYANSNGGGTITAIQEFNAELFFDLEVQYSFLDNYKVALGARNIFDNYPDPGEIGETCCGRIYRSDSIVDWQGGFYYARLEASF